MERRKASDFPPQVLELFDGYVHGRISRRDFLDNAGKFAVGGFTAAAMLESLRPNYALAQQVAKDDRRIKTEYVSYPSPRGSGRLVSWCWVRLPMLWSPTSAARSSSTERCWIST